MSSDTVERDAIERDAVERNHYREIYPKVAGYVLEAAQDGSFAQQLFTAHQAQDIMDLRFTMELMAMGVHGYNNAEFDDYDESFELKGATPGVEFTPEQCEKLGALGFQRCWICYTDGTEKYYTLDPDAD